MNGNDDNPCDFLQRLRSFNEFNFWEILNILKIVKKFLLNFKKFFKFVFVIFIWNFKWIKVQSIICREKWERYCFAMFNVWYNSSEILFSSCFCGKANFETFRMESEVHSNWISLVFYIINWIISGIFGIYNGLVGCWSYWSFGTLELWFHSWWEKTVLVNHLYYFYLQMILWKKHAWPIKPA